MPIKENESKNEKFVFIDKVYILTKYKWAACVTAAKQCSNTIFVAWFAETALQCSLVFEQNNVGKNRVILASKICKNGGINSTIIFIEHYPLRQKMQQLVANLEKDNIVVLSAMDEALFKHFGSDKMLPIIKLFGFKEKEAIQHTFVTTAIIKGQQKIESVVTVDNMCNSQTEWMLTNMPK
jgi:hypothetical protein